MSRRWLLIAGIASTHSCGQTTAPSENVSPFDEFRTTSSDFPKLLLCEQSSLKSGCARLQTSGDSVGGQFVFEDLLVKCTKRVDGFQIQFSTNQDFSSLIAPGVLGEVSFVSPEPGKGAFVCSGYEFDNQGNTKSKSCLVGFNLQGRSFFTEPRTPCIVILSSTQPTKGSLECPDLFSGAKNLHVSKNSRFSCPSGSP